MRYQHKHGLLRVIVLLILTVLLTIFIPYLAKAETPEWVKHETAWVSPGHAWFSLFGFYEVTRDDADQSKREGWWGDSVIYVDRENQGRIGHLPG